MRLINIEGGKGPVHRLIEGQDSTYPYFSTRQSTFFKINPMEISEKNKSTSVFQATDPDQPEISTSRMASAA